MTSDKGQSWGLSPGVLTPEPTLFTALLVCRTSGAETRGQGGVSCASSARPGQGVVLGLGVPCGLQEQRTNLPAVSGLRVGVSKLRPVI